MKTFILYYKNREIGILTETNWDMRSGGDIKYKYNYLSEDKKNDQISKYIIHSIQATIYLESGDEINYKRMCQEETQFLDLMDSSEWRIESKDGKSRRILCPVFLNDNGITWQKHYD